MSKIVVNKQEYTNNGPHSDEIKAVVRADLITSTLSTDEDVAPSVGLLKSETDEIKDALSQPRNFIPTGSGVASYDASRCLYARSGNIMLVNFVIKLTASAHSSGEAIINWSDLGLSASTAISGLQFAIGFSPAGSLVKVVAVSNTYIQVEALSGTFPANENIYGEIALCIN